MDLEKVSTGKTIESKKPLTQEQAVQRLLELESELQQVYYKNPNRTDWVTQNKKNMPLGIRSNTTYLRSTERFPLMPLPKHSSYNSTLYKKQIESAKRTYRYSFPAGLSLATVWVTTVALTPFASWIALPAFVFLAIGAIDGISSSLKLYDGSKKSKIRHFLASLSLTKKSKKIIEEHKRSVEKFELLKPTYEALAKIARLEIEKDNLLEIANQSPNDEGNYLVFLEYGIFAWVKKDKYLEMKEANKNVPTKEEILERAQKMLNQKCESLKMEALSK